jgi:hypothetical protein
LGNVGMTFTLGDRLGQDEVVVSVTTVMNIWLGIQGPRFKPR